MARDTSGELLTRVSFVLAVTAVAIVFLVPLVSAVDPADDPTGTSPEADERVTLVEREGTVVTLATIGLAVTAGMPLLFRQTLVFKSAQRLAALGLVVGVLLTITSIGVLFMPSALFTALGASRRRERHPLRPPDL